MNSYCKTGYENTDNLRILVATAILENMGFMTADEKILGNRHIRSINARK